MASVKDMTGLKNYCDLVFNELTGMKARLNFLIETISHMQGDNREMVGANDRGPHDHISHLRDIENTIEWKLEILTKVCPADWKGYASDAESGSVKIPEKFEDVVPGDFGG